LRTKGGCCCCSEFDIFIITWVFYWGSKYHKNKKKGVGGGDGNDMGGGWNAGVSVQKYQQLSHQLLKNSSLEEMDESIYYVY
jgi:hypothetical protein